MQKFFNCYIIILKHFSNVWCIDIFECFVNESLFSPFKTVGCRLLLFETPVTSTLLETDEVRLTRGACIHSVLDIG